MALLIYKENRLLNVADLFTLVPGVNEVPDKALEKAREVALFRDHYMNPMDPLVIEIGKVKSVSQVSAMTEPEALKLVGDTVSEGLLKTMLRVEKRGAVIEAIQAQLEKIKVEPSAVGKR